MFSETRRQTIADLLRRTARRVPHKVAIHCGGVVWNYSELEALCDRLAAGLAAHGVAQGRPCRVLARNSHAFAALRFALARQAALQGTEVAQFIALPGVGIDEPADDMLSFARLDGSTAALPSLELTGGDLVQIVYISGTESLPKGAMLTHEAVQWQHVSCIVEGEMSADDLGLHSLPLYLCAQLDCFLGPGIYLGTTNIITSVLAHDNLLPLIARHRITPFFAPPTVWIALLRSPLFDQTDLGSLREGYYGASIMPVEVMKEIQRRLPQIRLWNFSGQTEIAPLATVLKPADKLRKPGSAGKPVLHIEPGRWMTRCATSWLARSARSCTARPNS